MEITEVRVKLMADPDDRLQAFCSITLDDCFVVRDLKIIEGSNGPFVAMPSRKLTAHCQNCKCKNHLRAAYCNQCGMRLKDDLAHKGQEGRAKLYADIAHPINSECREMIQARVIQEFHAELDRSSQPDYVSRYDDDYDDDVEGVEDLSVHRPAVATHIDTSPSKPNEPHRSPDSNRTETSTPAPKHRSSQTRPDADDFGAGIF
ncbi:MAG: SpoVG family protein [Planctomycetales bacterium]|nr:SpoVG family protein [Planctomycetales bacterium]